MSTYLAGHRGMVGGAILKKLNAKGVDTIVRTHTELDLTDQHAVRDFMQSKSLIADKAVIDPEKLADPR